MEKKKKSTPHEEKQRGEDEEGKKGPTSRITSSLRAGVEGVREKAEPGVAGDGVEGDATASRFPEREGGFPRREPAQAILRIKSKQRKLNRFLPYHESRHCCVGGAGAVSELSVRN